MNNDRETTDSDYFQFFAKQLSNPSNGKTFLHNKFPEYYEKYKVYTS